MTQSTSPDPSSSEDAPSLVEAEDWRSLIAVGLEVENYVDLEQMKSSADVVIEATVDGVALRRFEQLDDSQPLNTVTEVVTQFRDVEILASAIGRVAESPISLLSTVHGPSALELSQGAIGDRGIFLLRDLRREASQLGLAPSEIEEYAGLYRTVSPQGVILPQPDDGLVIPLDPGGPLASLLAASSYSEVRDRLAD